MNHLYINENHIYPFSESLFNEGVFVLWKLKKETVRASKPTWHTKMLWNYKEDKEFFNELRFNGAVKHYFGVFEGIGDVDYVAINESGEILLTNFDAIVSTDTHGVMKITAESKPELRHYVLPAESITNNGKVFFINGANVKELKRSADRAMLGNIVKKPKNYKRNKGLITDFTDYEPTSLVIT